MAIRQYIGARYVPKYMGHFDSTREYEPLSVVDDANGNSYTSKVPVPAGSSLDDTRYWAQTGNFSGAVLQLQNRMTSAEGNISSLQSAVSGLDGDVSNLHGDVSTLQQDVDDLESKLTDRKILFVADSYGNYSNTQGKKINNIFSEMSGIPSDMVYQSSIGFKTSPNNFATLLTTYSGDKTKITDIIVIGGANDIQHSEQTLLQGVRQFLTNCEAFPNLKNISCFACGVALTGSTNVTYGQTAVHVREYSTYLPQYGIPVVDNSFYILCNTKFLRDKVHPNDDGFNVIAAQLYNYIKGCGITCDYGISIAYTPTSQSVISISNTVMLRHNDYVALRGSAPGFLPIIIRCSLLVNSEGTVNEFDAATYDDTLIDTNEYPSWIPVQLTYSDATKENAIARISYVDYTLKLAVTRATAGKTITQILSEGSVVPLV